MSDISTIKLDSLKPMTQEELIARALESEVAIRNGDVVDIDELSKEYETDVFDSPQDPQKMKG